MNDKAQGLFLSRYRTGTWFRRSVDACVILALFLLVAVAHALLSLSSLGKLSDMLRLVEVIKSV